MSKNRLRKVEAILSKLREKAVPRPLGVIIEHGETEEERKADVERQLAAYPKDGSGGSIVIMPAGKPPPK